MLFAKNEEPKISDKFPDLFIPINKATLVCYYSCRLPNFLLVIL